MIVVTGATGQLGRLVVERLLEKVPAAQIVALVRDPEKAQALAQKGVQVRQADYSPAGDTRCGVRRCGEGSADFLKRGRPPCAAASGSDRCGSRGGR